jgi:hypothetical protein
MVRNKNTNHINNKDMAKINGTLVLLTVGGNPIVHVDNATFNSSLSLAQATDKGSGGFMEYLESAGLKEASIDINGNADFLTDSGNVKVLADALNARTNLSFAFGPAGATNVNITGQCLISDHSLDTPNEETATFTATATVNGTWTVGVGS